MDAIPVYIHLLRAKNRIDPAFTGVKRPRGPNLRARNTISAMSPEGQASGGVGAMERLVEAVLANDPQAVADALDPDVTWHHNVGEGTPMEGSYHGPAAVLRLVADIFEAWEFLAFDDATIEERGDRVVHTSQVRMRGRESLELSLPGRVELRLAGDRIVEVWVRLSSGGR